MTHRLLLVLPLLLAPSLARAHAILVSSSPPAGGHVAPGPATLELRYNSRIDQGRSRVTLSHAGTPGEQRLALLPMEKPDLLRADATLAVGDYVLHWFVLATDGHITRGDVPFSVSAPEGVAQGLSDRTTR